MNKIFYLLLIALIVCSIKCVEDCKHPDSSRVSVDYCNSLQVDTGDYRCCFVEYSGGKDCRSLSKEEYDDIDRSLSKEEYDDIDRAIDAAEGEGWDDVDIDCGSKYIISSLLTVILILL